MALEVIFAPRAEQDLDDIYSYIAADNPVAARELIIRLEQVCRLLADRPYIGPSVTLPTRAGLRKMSSAPYIVFYRVTEQSIEIARILHSSRDLSRDDLF